MNTFEDVEYISSAFESVSIWSVINDNIFFLKCF